MSLIIVILTHDKPTFSAHRQPAAAVRVAVELKQDAIGNKIFPCIYY